MGDDWAAARLARKRRFASYETPENTIVTS
jgi:hypothetical protein